MAVCMGRQTYPLSSIHGARMPIYFLADIQTKMKLTLKLQLLTAVLALSVFSMGCSSLDRNEESSSASMQKGLKRLQVGMTYKETARALRPMDPEIKKTIEEILEQERDATAAYKDALAELRAAGVQTTPKLRSSYTVDRGDYILEFQDGKLASWNSR